MAKRAVVIVGTLVAVMAGLAACANGNESPPPLPTVDGYDHPDTFLDDMRVAGASSRQIDLATRAIDTESIALDVVRQAIEDDTFACLDAAGIGHSTVQITTVEWFPVPTYTMSEGVGLGPEKSLAIADTCVAQHSLYVEILYQNQPVALEASQAKKARVAQLVRKCLEQEGEKTDAAATDDEVIRTGLDHDRDSDRLCVLEADDAAAAEYIAP